MTPKAKHMLIDGLRNLDNIFNDEAKRNSRRYDCTRAMLNGELAALIAAYGIDKIHATAKENGLDLPPWTYTT